MPSESHKQSWPHAYVKVLGPVEWHIPQALMRLGTYGPLPEDTSEDELARERPNLARSPRNYWVVRGGEERVAEELGISSRTLRRKLRAIEDRWFASGGYFAIWRKEGGPGGPRQTWNAYDVDELRARIEAFLAHPRLPLEDEQDLADGLGSLEPWTCDEPLVARPPSSRPWEADPRGAVEWHTGPASPSPEAPASPGELVAGDASRSLPSMSADIEAPTPTHEVAAVRPVLAAPGGEGAGPVRTAAGGDATSARPAGGRYGRQGAKSLDRDPDPYRSRTTHARTRGVVLGFGGEGQSSSLEAAARIRQAVPGYWQHDALEVARRYGSQHVDLCLRYLAAERLRRRIDDTAAWLYRTFRQASPSWLQQYLDRHDAEQRRRAATYRPRWSVADVDPGEADPGVEELLPMPSEPLLEVKSTSRRPPGDARSSSEELPRPETPPVFSNTASTRSLFDTPRVDHEDEARKLGIDTSSSGWLLAYGKRLASVPSNGSEPRSIVAVGTDPEAPSPTKPHDAPSAREASR